MQPFKQAIRRFHHRLSDIDALPQLTLLGIIVGVLASLCIVAFRLLIEVPLAFFLPQHNENFEALSASLHFFIPVIGATLIALMLYFTPKQYHGVSVGNVLDRLHNHQGHMSAGNFLVQFFGGVVALVSGQSVGREGPAVHIGASAASLFGQYLKLPNNSLRTLIACGVAAAIAASFDTPVAGVIFAMEVVLMSYSIVGFIPVMMASVCGSFITRLVFNEASPFAATELTMHGLWEVPLMICVGFVIGIFATIYMRLQLGFSRLNTYPIHWRLLIAGCVTGILAIAAPEILGLGYDTVNLALEGKLAIGALALILVAKMLATSFSIAMGMPAGLIGPQLFMGACIGAMTGHVISLIFPGEASNTGFYVLLGMAAMMGAVINAPLAALIAVLELSYNPAIMFPSMLIIVIACITTRQLFKCEGIFIEQLAVNGKSLASKPSQQILSNIGVRSAMNSAYIEASSTISCNEAKQLLNNKPLWVVISDGQQKTLLRASDLALYIASANQTTGDKESIIDLFEIPAQRLSLHSISELATLYEAQQYIEQQQVDALYVVSQTGPGKLLGIITQASIDNHYKL